MSVSAVQLPQCPALPNPTPTSRRGRSRLRFFHGDAIEILNALGAGSVDAVVTSPPYNLGIRYRTYDDGRPREEYLEWTGDWVRPRGGRCRAEGSLFLNVGAKPKDPWTALDVAQAVRPHLELQNIIHWVKSIAIEKALAGARSGLADDLAVGHYKPINSQRFLNDCHEFVFHFSPHGRRRRSIGTAVGVKYQDESNVTRWQKAGSGLRCRGNTWFLPYDTIQSRDKERPHPATFPWRLPAYCLKLHGVDAHQARGRSVPGTGQFGRRLRDAGGQLRRHRARRALPEGSDRARQGALSKAP